MADYLLHQDGFKIILQDGSGFVLLEDQPPANPPVLLTPAPADAIAATAGPTVVKGSMTISGTGAAAAAAIAETVDPTVVISSPGTSITVTPASADAIAETAGPTVVLGSVTITPASADAIAETSVTVDVGEIFLPSVTITPAPAEAIASTEIGLIIKTIGFLFTPEAAQVAIVWDPEDPLQ